MEEEIPISLLKLECSRDNKGGKIMNHSNKKTGRIINRMLIITLLVGISVFLKPDPVCAHAQKTSESYTLTIHYPDGKMKRLEGVLSHKLISEKDTVFLSLILKDGRRFLISVHDREFEFSPELSLILEAESKKNVEME